MSSDFICFCTPIVRWTTFPPSAGNDRDQSEESHAQAQRFLHPTFNHQHDRLGHVPQVNFKTIVMDRMNKTGRPSLRLHLNEKYISSHATVSSPHLQLLVHGAPDNAVLNHLHPMRHRDAWMSGCVIPFMTHHLRLRWTTIALLNGVHGEQNHKKKKQMSQPLGLMAFVDGFSLLYCESARAPDRQPAIQPLQLTDSSMVILPRGGQVNG